MQRSNSPTQRSNSPTQRSSWLRRTAVFAALTLLVVTSGPADAQDSEKIKELRSQRKEVQEAEAEAAAAIDVATATADDLVAALAKVQTAVDTQQAEADAAQFAVTEAEARQKDAEIRKAILQEELTAAQLGLREAVITSYVSFQSPSGSVNFLGPDPWRNARDETLANFATGLRIDNVDELRRIGAELEQYQALADEAATDAQTRRAEASAQLIELNEARSREAELTAKASERLETRLYEAQALAELDAELAASISREERRIAEALARARAEAAARAAAATLPPNSNIDLVSVRGIVVNSAIAEQTEGLLAAMEAEGFVLRGGGYRSHTAQISLRRAHCGTSNYAIWQMPASRCRPPTARPGRSDHETGRAIDFTYNGRIISRRNSDVFRALQRIAPQYGFKNLPSEPWHWSNT